MPNGVQPHMRWRSGLYIFLTELVAAALTAAAGLLTNVLTNEPHPKTALIVAFVTFVVSSGILQAARHAIAEKKEQASNKILKEVDDTTRAILSHQQDADRNKTEEHLDEILARFPTTYRSWIREQWREDNQGVKRVLDALNESMTTPSAVVLEWQQLLPDWFQDLGWRALLVAGELANAYGANQLSVDLFITAVDAGATREQYWRARAALLQKFQEQPQAANQTLADGSAGPDSQDSFVRIVFYYVTGDLHNAQSLLDRWAPEALIDILLTASIRVAIIFADVDGSAAPTLSHFARAAAAYRNAMEAVPQSASARLGLANVLVGAAAAGASPSRHRDLQEATERALEARDLCRANRSSSVQAVELACQAAYSDMMVSRVIEIGTAVTGEATIEEANSDIVRTLVASAAIAKGRTDISDRLISEITDPFRKAILLAMAAEAAGNPSASLWQGALNQARDAAERAQALLGLARMGVTDLPGLEDVQPVSPHEGALIQAVAAAASGSVSSAIQQLRAMSDVDFNSVTTLTDAYLKAGNVVAAVDVLREGAHTLNEPRLRVEAARLLWQDDKKNDARVELEALLVDTGSDVALRHDCLAQLGQWAADQREWSTAQGRFQELLALDERDSQARWAVILVMLRRGLISDARRVYESAPSELSIALPEHARAWMVIKADSEHADVAQFVERVIDVAQLFSDHEDVQAEAIFTVLSPDGIKREPLPPSTQARFNHLFERFFDVWPNSSRLHRFSASDIQTLVSQMEELVRPTQEEKTLRIEVAERLAQNTLPWAFLSAMTGRSYSEIVTVRAGGVLPARHIDVAEQQICREAAQAAMDMSVVVDISAAAVMMELPDTSNLLIGQFQRLIVSEGERLDATKAVAFLRSRSTSSWIYDEQNDRGHLATISEELANQRYDKATQLLNFVNRCRVVPVVDDSRFNELGGLATSSWVTAVQCAAQSGVAFWCDDVALRAVARSIGVAAFSTPALLEVLLDRGVLSAIQHENAVRRLIEGLVGDFPLDQARLSALVAKGREVAGPVASIFSRSSAWAHVN
jgi:DNA-binding SARP family transcriptional activator